MDKTCHTIPMLLIGNTALSGLIMDCVFLGCSIFALRNDLQQIVYEDSLCVVRAYIGYASYTIFNYSFALQAFYRYIIVVYPTRLVFQSLKFQLMIICLTWIFSFVYSIAYIFIGEIHYDSDNQACQSLLRFSFINIYEAVFGYSMPISLIIFVYWKLVRYVQEMSKNVTPVNTLVRVKRELKMVRRVVILVTFLIITSFPYLLMFFMSLFNRAPKYHFRIIYIFFNTAVLSVVIALYQFTDPIKTSLMKTSKCRRTVIVPTIT